MMVSVNVSKASLEELLYYVRFYPSGDNMQPFRFRLKDSVISIFFDHLSADHPLDVKHHASHITLGCVLFYLEVASKALGIEIETKLGNLKQIIEPWAVIQTKTLVPNQKAIESSKISLEKIMYRHTNRYPYRPAELGLLQDQVAKTLDGDLSNISIVSIANLQTSDFENILTLEKEFWLDQQAVKKTFKTVFFSHKKFQLAGTGFHWKDLGIQIFEVPAILMFRCFPKLPAVLIRLGLGTVILDSIRKLLTSSTVFIGMKINLTNPEQAPEKFFEVGRLACKLWVELNSAGFAVQPLTNLSMRSLDLNNYSTSENAHKIFSLKPNESLGWAFRVGYAKVQVTKNPKARLNVEALQQL